MSDEQYKKIRITRDDLIDWIDRPPSNSDIELCDYLVNALDNQYKYYNEIQQLKYVIEEVRQLALKQIDISNKEIDRIKYLHKYDSRQGLLIGQEQDLIKIQENVLQILDKAKEVTKR